MNKRTLEARALWGESEDRPDPAGGMRGAIRWAEATGATHLRALLRDLEESLYDTLFALDAREYGDARRSADDAVLLFAQLRRELGLGD